LEFALEKSGIERKEFLNSIEFDGEIHDAISDLKYQISVLVKCRQVLGLTK
jgi:hypothetical protein